MLAGGHTTGSVIFFVAVPSGKRYAFVGDLTWQLDGIRRRVERPWLLRKLADCDSTQVRQNLLRIIALADLLHTSHGPLHAVEPFLLREAFHWSEMRRVTNTASVSLAGNRYTVDAALVGRRVELRLDPEDLTKLDVYWAGHPAGQAIPFISVGTCIVRCPGPTPAAGSANRCGLPWPGAGGA